MEHYSSINQGIKIKKQIQLTQHQHKPKPLKLGIVTITVGHPALDAIYKGLQDELKNEGYEVGKNLEMTFKTRKVTKVT